MASLAHDDLPHTIQYEDGPLKDKKFLPVVALYGANASGKSNFLDAFNFFHNAIQHSYSRWEERQVLPHPFFALDSESQDQESSYECDVAIDGVRHQYGFALTKTAINKEWLYSYPKGARNILFQRDFSESAEIGSEIYFGASLKKIGELWKSIASNRKTLLLSAAGRKDHAHDQLTPIFRYFKNRFQAVEIKENGNELMLATQIRTNNIEKKLIEVLKKADFGIIGINIRTEEMDDQQQALIKGIENLMKENFGSNIEKLDVKTEQLRIDFVHACDGNKTHTLPYTKESSGTRYLLSLLIPVISALENGKTLIVDEITTNLHTKLSEQIVALFTSKEINKTNAQFIFSTHDTNLLSRDLLRRDEIWFAEKDDRGATTIYPLTDFKIRKTDNIEKGYLQGRFGAIPFVGDIASLLS